MDIEESEMAVIKTTTCENNLEKFMYNEFLDILWGSFVKK